MLRYLPYLSGVTHLAITRLARALIMCLSPSLVSVSLEGSKIGIFIFESHLTYPKIFLLAGASNNCILIVVVGSSSIPLVALTATMVLGRYRSRG